MTEQQLASIYYVMLMKEFPKEDATIKLWEFSKKLARVPQPKKKYQDLYNSIESRNQRSKLKGES